MRRMHNVLEFFEPLEGVTVSIKGQGNKSGPTSQGLHISRNDLVRFQTNSRKLDPSEVYYRKVSLGRFAKKPAVSKGSLPRIDERGPPASVADMVTAGSNSLAHVPHKSTLIQLMKGDTDRDLLLLQENVRPKVVSHSRELTAKNQRLNGVEMLYKALLTGNGTSAFDDEPRHGRAAVIPPNRLPRTVYRRKSHGLRDALSQKAFPFW